MCMITTVYMPVFMRETESGRKGWEEREGGEKGRENKRVYDRVTIAPLCLIMHFVRK